MRPVVKEKFFRRVWRYKHERFPLRQFIPLSLLLAGSASLGTQVFLHSSFYDTRAFFLCTAALFLFLFRLRLFDECKDSDHDKQYYPQRPVPRGLVSLQELRSLSFFVFGLEIAVAFESGGPAYLFFLIAALYSWLMFKEFYIGDWLRHNFTAYIFSHEILLVPLFYYLYSVNGFLTSDMGKPFFVFLTVFLGGELFLLEVARKIRPKEIEIGSRDTYTAQYGILGASLLLLTIGMISSVALQISVETVFKQIPIAVAVFSDGLVALLSVSLYFFVKKQNKKSAGLVFAAAIIAALLGCVLFIAAIVVCLHS